ncbi:MAG: hypothetical protein ACXWJD_13385, partial [Burkholderiaceae bacterium]
GDNAKAAWSQLILGLMAFVGIGTLFSAIAIINIIWLFTQPNWFALLLLSISIAFVVSSLRNLRNDLTTFRKNVDRPDVPPQNFYEKLAWDDAGFSITRRDGAKESMLWEQVARITYYIEEVDDFYGYCFYRYWSISGENGKIEFSAEAKDNKDFALFVKERLSSFNIDALGKLKNATEEKHATLWVRVV